MGKPSIQIITGSTVAATTESGPWIPVSTFVENFNLSYTVELTVDTTASTYTVEGTLADVIQVTPSAASIFTIETSSAAMNGSTTNPITGIRCTIAKGSGASTTTFRTLQTGV